MSDPESHHAFERIVRPHFDRLYRLAFRLCADRSRAEDLFQELLIKAFGKLDELASIEHPGSWLGRIMYNLFVDDYRRYQRQRLHVVDEAHLAGSIDDLPGGNDPRAESERDETWERLDAALAELSDEHRIVVLLHDTEGYKLEEIQSLMDVPIGTIKSRLHRARARLKEILVKDGTLS